MDVAAKIQNIFALKILARQARNLGAELSPTDEENKEKVLCRASES